MELIKTPYQVNQPKQVILRTSQHRYLVKTPKGDGTGRRYKHQYWDTQALLVSDSCVFKPELTTQISTTHAEQIISMFNNQLENNNETK